MAESAPLEMTKSSTTDFQVEENQPHKETNESEEPIELERNITNENRQKCFNKPIKITVPKIQDTDSSHIETNIEIAEFEGPVKKPRIKKSFFKKDKNIVSEDDKKAEVLGSELNTKIQTPEIEREETIPSNDNQIAEIELQPKKTLVERIITIQENCHIVASGMRLVGTVMNKIGEEINENFATKSNGKPRARTTELANKLEKVGKSLMCVADFEDKVNDQIEMIKDA